MTLALVLRLLPDHLAEGSVAGWVEEPLTGARHRVRNGSELLAVLRSMRTEGASGDESVLGGLGALGAGDLR